MGLDVSRASAQGRERVACVFATGFEDLRGQFTRIDSCGRGGQSLKEKWSSGPRTYLGVAAEGFPNMFMITGPGSPSVLGNMPTSIEQHVDWICDCLTHAAESGAQLIEATAAAESDWGAHVQELANDTLFPQTDSWYLGANIPGNPQVFLPYIGGFGTSRGLCDVVANYCTEGFVMA